MAIITEDYVSFEIAKLLKEKGFQAKCTACYRSDLNNAFELISGRINYCNPRFSKCKSIPPYNAPTLQMAMKWLREEKKIGIEVNTNFDIDDGNKWYYEYGFCIFQLSGAFKKFAECDYDGYKTYEEACEAAIKYCLEILI